jgi:hypothetical protein
MRAKENQCEEKNPGCQFCDNNQMIDVKEKIYKCRQCKATHFLNEGRCVETCPENTKANLVNRTCYPKPSCELENCDECGSSTTCKTCTRGFFKYGNGCLSRCPEGYRADRITWTCLEPPIFAWYWVYPSRSSCRNYCGYIVQEDWDCSCSSDCFFYGNCCQDIDYYCDEILFWKKSGSELTKSKNSKTKPNPSLPSLPGKNNNVPENKKNEKKENPIKNEKTKKANFNDKQEIKKENVQRKKEVQNKKEIKVKENSTEKKEEVMKPAKIVSNINNLKK